MKLTLRQALGAWLLGAAPGAVKGDIVNDRTLGMAGYSTTDPQLASEYSRIYGTQTHTGKPINERSAMEVTAFWACCRIIAESHGMLPGRVCEKQKDGSLVPVDHDLNTILFESPNTDMTPVEMHECLGANMAQQGNAISIIDRRSDKSIISMTPIAAGLTTVGRDRTTGNIKFDIYDRGRWEEYPREKIWHQKLFSFGGLVGLSPLVYGRQALGIALATEEFQAKFFAQGASPSFIVSVPAWLTPVQRAAAREQLDKLWGGLDNAHKARLLEGGMTPHDSTMKLQEAQFHELRGLTVQEICRIMRIPPHMVMDLSRSTNNNIEHQSLEFLMYAVAPYINRMESSITKWLFRAEERSRFVVKYDVDAILRMDSVARADYISKLTQNAVMSRNEGRRINGMNKSTAPGMDDYTAQINLAPIGMLPELARAQVAKASRPEPAKLLRLVADDGTPGTA